MATISEHGQTVNGVWYPPPGYCNLSEGSGSEGRFYQCTIHRFQTGSVEVTTKLVGSLRYKRFAESAALGGLVRSHKDIDIRNQEQIEADKVASDLENLQRAVRRAKKGVRHAIKAIGGDHLLTLTYRSPQAEIMDDIEKLKRDWKEFCRLMRKGLPSSNTHRSARPVKDWKFCAVREKQQNGAYHLHIAVVGRQDIGYIRRCWYLAIGGTQDDHGTDVKGQIDVVGPKKRWGTKQQHYSPDKLAGYMCKYLGKTIDEVQEEKGAKRYWVGRANDKPEVEKIWLTAQDFYEAVKESHKIFRGHCSRGDIVLWASNGYETVWLSG